MINNSRSATAQRPSAVCYRFNNSRLHLSQLIKQLLKKYLWSPTVADQLKRKAANNSRLYTAHTQQHGRQHEKAGATSVRQQLLAIDPGGSSRSSTRPRRRRVLAASTGDGTGLDNDGVVERLAATNERRRRRSTRCTLTTGCLDSSASTDQFLVTARTVHRRRRTTWLTAGLR